VRFREFFSVDRSSFYFLLRQSGRCGPVSILDRGKWNWGNIKSRRRGSWRLRLCFLYSVFYSLFSIAWSESYSMSDSSCALQSACSSVCMVPESLFPINVIGNALPQSSSQGLIRVQFHLGQHVRGETVFLEAFCGRVCSVSFYFYGEAGQNFGPGFHFIVFYFSELESQCIGSAAAAVVFNVY
jgi:hypothetical protein